MWMGRLSRQGATDDAAERQINCWSEDPEQMTGDRNLSTNELMKMGSSAVAEYYIN